MRILFLGLAGAGKGTQAKMIAEHLKLPFISSGDLFRLNQAENTELGIIVKSYMERGELVPDDVTINMILERLNQSDAQEGFVLDGFPRTLEQARALDQALGSRLIDRSIYIRVGAEELVRRLAGRISCRKCGTPYQKSVLDSQGINACPSCGGPLYQRTDDEPKVVRRRLDVQTPEIELLIGYYNKQHMLVEINGEHAVETVAQDTIMAISEPARTPSTI
jgi:adenylate kinase